MYYINIYIYTVYYLFPHSPPPASKILKRKQRNAIFSIDNNNMLQNNTIYCANGKVKLLKDYPLYIYIIMAFLKLNIFKIKKNQVPFFSFRSKSSLKKQRTVIFYTPLSTCIKKSHYIKKLSQFSCSFFF